VDAFPYKYLAKVGQYKRTNNVETQYGRSQVTSGVRLHVQDAQSLFSCCLEGLFFISHNDLSSKFEILTHILSNMDQY